MERRKEGGTRTKCYVINSDNDVIQSCIFQHNSTDGKIFNSDSTVPTPMTAACAATTCICEDLYTVG